MNYIYLIMQQKQILKNAIWVDALYFAKTNLANLKSDVEKQDIDKLKNEAANLSNLKSKLDKLDADRFVPVPTALCK